MLMREAAKPDSRYTPYLRALPSLRPRSHVEPLFLQSETLPSEYMPLIGSETMASPQGLGGGPCVCKQPDLYWSMH